MEFTTIMSNLKKLGYLVTEFNSADEATQYLAGELQNKTIGMGGSVTIGEMNLYEALTTNNQVYWHMSLKENRGVTQTLKKAREAEIYISSVNAIASTGEIINIDKTGNRVAAISYGHEKVYFVVGENKITADVKTAYERARNIAAPLNAKRLNRKTPCAVHGDHCYDCKSPDRICRNFSIFTQSPAGSAYEVVLIHEKLGY